jgi:PAS domain S-box-containing protein
MENGDIDREAMREGASDYLVKGNFDSEMLERTIRYAARDALLLQTLEVSTSRFRNIFERAADPIILIDQHGIITEANPAFLNMFPDNPETTKKQVSFLSLIKDSRHVSFIERLIAAKEEWGDLETRLKIDEHIQIDVLIRIALHDSQAVIFQVMIKDLTTLRIKEEETRNLKRFSATGRIARIMAHEVKNPLTNITLSADQLRTELPESVIKESGDLIDIIHRNCTRINQLVSELLQSTRFAELQMGKHSINQLLEDALDMARDRINLKKIRVENAFSYDICDIELDAERVKIAFLNLIVNAIEAMEPEKGILKIVTSVKDGKCIIEITIMVREFLMNTSSIYSNHFLPVR